MSFTTQRKCTAALVALTLPLVLASPARAATVGDHELELESRPGTGCALDAPLEFEKSKQVKDNGKKSVLKVSGSTIARSTADPSVTTKLKASATHTVQISKAKGSFKKAVLSTVGTASAIGSAPTSPDACDEASITVDGSMFGEVTIAKKGTVTVSITFSGTGYSAASFALVSDKTAYQFMGGSDARSATARFKVKPGVYAMEHELDLGSTTGSGIVLDASKSSMNFRVTITYKGA